jgi:hypothetical protein
MRIWSVSLIWFTGFVVGVLTGMFLTGVLIGIEAASQRM